MSDTLTPNGTSSAPNLSDLLPPNPDEAPVKPKRPTTRAERAAQAAANKAKKEAAGKSDTKPKTSSSSKPRQATLEKRITDSLVSLGTITGAAGMMMSPALKADGIVIVENAASLAKALCKVADQDPKVKAALERMLTAGVWSGLIGALLPVVLAIMANHNAIPAPIAALLGSMAGPPPTPENAFTGPVPESMQRAAGDAAA